MSSNSETKGQIKNTAGQVQETIGNAVGSDDMKAKGNKNQVDGTMEETAAKVANVAQGTYDYVTGIATDAMGKVTGSNTDQTRGKMTEEKGKMQM